MGSKSDVYVSISKADYRENKSKLLSSQANLLVSLKYMHNLRVLLRQKIDLKIQLKKSAANILNELEKLEEKMPEPSLPKEMKEKSNKKSKAETIDRKKSIDEELMQIKQKLRALQY